MGEQSLQVLENLLSERDDELREKEQLQTKTSDYNVLLADVQNKGYVLAECAEVRSAPTFELPLRQRVSRRIHDAELTCIASGPQVAPLPRSLSVAGTADGIVKLLDGETGRPHAQLYVSRELARTVAVDLTRSGLLLAASSDYAVRLLDLHAQKLRHTLRGHLGALSSGGCARRRNRFSLGSQGWGLHVCDSARAPESQCCGCPRCARRASNSEPGR